MIIDGKQLANEILENLKLKMRNAQCVNALTGVPTMAVILVGDNPASLSYIKQKQLSAEKIGAKVILKKFPVSISPNSPISQISQLNSDLSIHGIIIQRPLPSNFDREKINLAVMPEKDIDGFHPQSKFLPPVALSVLQSLFYCYSQITCHSERSEESLSNNFQFSIFNFQFINWLNSQSILLLGRGETGGKPIANTMDKLKIKYTQTHSKTQNIKELLQQADIIISAVGIPNLITGDMIKEGAICIGVGLSRLSATNKQQTASKPKDRNVELEAGSWKPEAVLTGDFDEITIASKASFYTPTPGGIGLLTVAFLLSNLISAFNTNTNDKD